MTDNQQFCLDYETWKSGFTKLTREELGLYIAIQVFSVSGKYQVEIDIVELSSELELHPMATKRALTSLEEKNLISSCRFASNIVRIIGDTVDLKNNWEVS